MDKEKDELAGIIVKLKGDRKEWEESVMEIPGPVPLALGPPLYEEAIKDVEKTVDELSGLPELDSFHTEGNYTVYGDREHCFFCGKSRVYTYRGLGSMIGYDCCPKCFARCRRNAEGTTHEELKAYIARLEDRGSKRGRVKVQHRWMLLLEPAVAARLGEVLPNVIDVHYEGSPRRLEVVSVAVGDRVVVTVR